MSEVDEIIRNIMITPVGFEYERILAGVNAFPVNSLYLLQSTAKTLTDEELKKSTNYKNLLKITDNQVKRVQTTLRSSILKIHTISIDLRDFLSIISTLQNIIHKEKLNKNTKVDKVYINVSTSSKMFAMAAYLFASAKYYDKIELFYLGTQNYFITKLFSDENNVSKKAIDFFKEHGESKGPYIIKNIPIFPLAPVTELEVEICYLLSKEKNLSIKEILDKKFPDRIKENRAQRMKISYALKNLERLGYINSIKKGRTKYISNSIQGQAIAVLLYSN